MTCCRSYFPRTHLTLTPGTSLSLPGLTKTTLCSCRLCPSPGIKATISFPVVSRTNTHLRLAELGFLGFLMSVLSTTPRAKGLSPKGFLFLRFFLMGPVRCICLRLAGQTGLVLKSRTCEGSLSGCFTRLHKVGAGKPPECNV